MAGLGIDVMLGLNVGDCLYFDQKKAARQNRTAFDVLLSCFNTRIMQL
jgi:hypothetical protein